MTSATAARPLLKVALGPEPAGALSLGLPVLAGEAVEAIFGPARPAGRSGAFALFQTDGWLLGAASVALTAGLEAATESAYADLFNATRGLHLARIWNYVPAINAHAPGAIENYQVFCRGRSLACERHLGADFKRFVPAASAVGSKGTELGLVFAASTSPVRHVENPLQVPAYDYPREHGPRSPSFARATITANGAVFISGTAAIRGHATVAPADTRRQLDCTLENLREISIACDLGAHFASAHIVRHFKVYLRHAADLPSVAAALEERLLQPGDLVTYLEADICRAPLNVEIEATLFRRSA